MKKKTSNHTINALLEILELEVNEKFIIYGSMYNPYYFDENGYLHGKEDHCYEDSAYMTALTELIHGYADIGKIKEEL